MLPRALPPDRFWTCEVCGQVLPNQPKPVLSHVMSHARPRPYAKTSRTRSLLVPKNLARFQRSRYSSSARWCGRARRASNKMEGWA
jgi:hypothetical protein